REPVGTGTGALGASLGERKRVQ
ncbi:MAG: hypothetical protein QOE54_6035, partial [Streptosporangiaceae bacterium]|nr:hypothetical protein [Streptosporangiaceae bacterium]